MDDDQATLSDPAVLDAPAAPAPAAPAPTMAETMRATLDSIKERDAALTDAPEQVAKPDRVRAPDGKFAKPDDIVAPVAPAAPEGSAAAPVTPGAEPQAAPPAPATEALAPPSSWTGAAKAEFAKASPVIQQEVLRREQQMHNGIAQYKDAANYGQSLHKVIQPFENTIRQLGIAPDVAVQALFQIDHQLRYGSPAEKMRAMANVAQTYGIDLSQGLPAQQQVDPNVQYFQSQLQSTQQQLQQVLTAQQQREQSELNSQIDAARQGKPHFDELRSDMAVLIQAAGERGQPITLEQAYEAALWASPVHRQELLTKQLADRQAEDAKQRADEAAKAQAAAKAAKAASSTNVNKRGTLQSQAPVGTVHDTMRETLAQIRAR